MISERCIGPYATQEFEHLRMVSSLLLLEVRLAFNRWLRRRGRGGSGGRGWRGARAVVALAGAALTTATTRTSTARARIVLFAQPTFTCSSRWQALGFAIETLVDLSGKGLEFVLELLDAALESALQLVGARRLVEVLFKRAVHRARHRVNSNHIADTRCMTHLREDGVGVVART